MNDHQMTNPVLAKAFVLGGNARFTVVSQKTHTRYTYQVQQAPDGKLSFVKLLTGPDNTSSYECFGMLAPNGQFRHRQKSKLPETAPAVKAFEWLWGHLSRDHLSDQVEFYHEGRCGRCNRPLTVPESIVSGFGPECSRHVGH